MDKDKLVSRLNWFYSLELNQVDLYKQQSKSFLMSMPDWFLKNSRKSSKHMSIIFLQRS